MSTLKSVNVIHPSSAVNNIVNDASGNVAVGNNLTVAGTATVTGATTLTGNVTATGTVAMGSSFKRNRIINGNMQIWQRGTSLTAASYSYIADRWAFGNFANTTVSQSTSVPTGFQYSQKVQRPSGATSITGIVALQTIESVNCYDLAGKSVTLSFYAKAGANYSSASNNLTVQVWTGTVADQGGSTYSSWTGAAQPINTTVTLTTTFQRFTVTGTIASNVLEMASVFSFTPVGTAGADDSFFITGVQLEVGTIATPYEMQIYSDQISQCYRYCFVAPANWFYAYGGSGSALVNFATTGYFPVPMRTTPTATGTISISNCPTPSAPVLSAYMVSYNSYNSTNGAAAFGNAANYTFAAEL
jgi:hypothetical protein